MISDRVGFEEHCFSWREGGGGEPVANRCLAFLAEIGVEVGSLGEHNTQLLDGLAIIEGRLLIEPETAVWPGDLLHEAGHIAVAAPEDRKTLSPITPDGADEMATIAWSYAAARECGVGLEHLFHDGGYRGDSATLREAFSNGSYIGAPMLGFYGMTDPDGQECEHPFPTMIRWMR